MAMTFAERLAQIRLAMQERGLDLLVAIHDGAHFIEKPNPVMVLTRFKSLGPAAALLDRDGQLSLIVTPAWDRDRAAEECPDACVVAADDVVDGITEARRRTGSTEQRITVGVAGRKFLPWAFAERVTAALPAVQPAVDDVVFGPARRKTDEEIAHAREATRIAELGYDELLRVAQPGMSEDELAVHLRHTTKMLGAEDNFLLLCAGPHNRAVQPSTGRRFAPGDIIVAEITPSYRGQLAQICRTAVLGRPSAQLTTKYRLVVEAMQAGISAAVPGVPMGQVCRAVNAVLERENYGEYCHPPHIRRRGHGLGFGSLRPGDVSLDNETILEPDMVFMIHPNQYLPETGYLLCGEPVLMTDRGAEPLTRHQAALGEIR
ncbi:MAG TPA: Xaa-Pro peptidase family protein [Xanthobacteraceae bacterium]|nr:Xaa-Pro peptidase family protein [Xanthobacteraceae bacterium]